MNPILEQWLAERQDEAKHNRELFLIKLGLIDPSKTTTIYRDMNGNLLTEEEANEKMISGLRVDKYTSHGAIDLTEEEFNQVLTYAQPQTLDNDEPSDHELLKSISRHTKTVSTIMVISVILSILVGIIVGINLGGM